MTLILSGTDGLSDIDGSAATPAIRGTDANTGIFFGTDIIGFSEGGAEVARFNADAQFVAAAGTASLPVITTTGDVNTGIFFPAADTIAFAEGGGEAARFDASGNLLVGTTSTYALPGSQSATVFTTTGYAVGNGTTSALLQNNKLAFNASEFYVINGNTGSGVGVFLNNGSTSWSSFSDERIKDIIEPISNASSKVSSLRAIIGKYKNDAEGTRRAFLIAQDVQAVLPEAVNVRDDEIGTLGLQYTDVIPLLVAAIQEQQALITALTTRITALEAA